jgi:uncharacterized membrane protein
MPFRPFITA